MQPKLEKRCRICKHKKDIYDFQTRIDQKSGLKVFRNICEACSTKECPACRTETIFVINRKPQLIDKFTFFRKLASGGRTKKKGWLCKCGYLVTFQHEDNNNRNSNIRS